MNSRSVIDASRILLENTDFEAMATSAPSGRAAWWISAQTATHVLSSVGARDPHTGEGIPSSLLATLRQIDRTLRRGVRPLPADRLQHAAEFITEPLREVLAQPRTRIVREHFMQPLHRVRELDAKSLDWLGRLPGRNVREKLSGRQHAMAVVRSFSPETLENHLVARLLHTLEPLLASRLAAVGAGAYDTDDRDVLRLAALKSCHELCKRGLRDETFGRVDHRSVLQANNVLLGDRRYSRLWRAWLWLRSYASDQRRMWNECADRVPIAVFWALVARLSCLPEVWICDTLATVSPGWGESPFSLTPLVHQNGESAWHDALTVSLVAPGRRAVSPAGVGRVTHKGTDKNGRPFGKISAAEGGDLYINERLLQRGTTWEDLMVGDRVLCIPREVDGRLQAMDVILAPDELLTVTLSGDKLSLGSIALAGDGVLQARYAEPETVTYQITLDGPGAVVPRRGVVCRAIRATSRGKAVACRDHADLTGFRLIVDKLSQSSPGSSVIASESIVRQDTETARTTIQYVGVDLGAVTPQVCANGEQVSVDTSLHAVKYWLPGGASHDWLVGQSSGWSDTLANVAQTVGIRDTFDPGPTLSERDAAIATTKVVQSLRDELDAEVGAASTAQAAYTVPETADEFSQQILRASFASVFAAAYPIWRAVALALGWQRTQKFMLSHVSAGDAVIVLEPFSNGLALTVLTARFDEELNRAMPDTAGLYWERRPPVSASAMPEDVSELSEQVTWKRLMEDYATRCLRPAVDAGQLQDDSIVDIVDRLSRLGVPECVICQQREALLPMGLVAPSAVIHLRYEPRRWGDSMRCWSATLADVLGRAAATDTMRALLTEACAPGHKRHLLLAGLPFSLPHMESQLAPTLRRLYPSLQIHWASADTTAATGAEAFLRRRAAGLPTWQDWLPELFLEVVKDGTFHELQLMESTVGGDAALGKAIQTEVAETLMLPPGRKSYSFPLLAGRTRSPLPFDARLESPSFPLAAAVRAKLTVQYRYGLQASYALAVTPDGDAGIPARAIKVTWVPRTRPESISPSYPETWPWNAPELDEFRVWLIEQSARLPSTCSTFFTGAPRSEADIQDFAETLRRRLEVPLRRLWDSGRTLSTAPGNVRAAANTDFIHWLAYLAGCPTPDFHAPSLADWPAKPMESVQDTALLLLSRLHADAPKPLTKILIDDFQHGTERRGLQALERMAFLVGDGQHERASLVRELSEAALRALKNDWTNPFHARALRGLSTAIWRHRCFLNALSAVQPSFAVDFAANAEAALKRLSREIASGATEKPQSWHIRWFASISQILLGLLLVRQWPSCPKGLGAGSPQLTRISRLVVELDRLIALRGVEPMRSTIRFSLTKPDALHRTSDLAYALRCYLTGDPGSALVHIASVDDETSEE